MVAPSDGAKRRKQARKPPQLPKRKARPDPRAQRKGVEISPFENVLRDFKAGIAALGALAGKLAPNRVLKHITPRRLAELRKTAPSLAKIVEREVRTVTKLVKSAPDIKHSSELIKTYKERAEKVIEQKLPQLYATILQMERAATKLQPAAVALPMTPTAPVKSLVMAARAIRAGRLPYLPRPIREQAQQVIDSIFKRSRPSPQAAAARAEQHKLIERYGLIPLTVRHDIVRELKRAPEFRHTQHTSDRERVIQRETPSERTLLRIVDNVIHERTQQLKQTSTETRYRQPPPTIHGSARAPRVSATAALPAFQRQGAVSGGDYLGHAGEDIHVISRNDRPLVESYERATAPQAPARAARPAPAQPVTVPSSPPAAPMPAKPAPRTAPAGVATTAAAATGTPQPRMAATQQSPMRIEGTLKIDGLADWVAKIEGRTKH